VTAQRSASGLAFHTLATRTAVRAIALLASVLLARALGPTDRGRYALALTLASLATALVTLGLEQAQLRLWSRRTATPDTFVTSSAALSATLGSACIPAIALAYLALRGSTLKGLDVAEMAIIVLVPGVQLHSVLAANLLTMDGYLERVNQALVASVAIAVGAATALYALHALDLVTALALFTGQALLNWTLLLRALRNVGHPRMPVPWRFMKRELATGVRIYPYELASILTFRIDVFLVAALAGVADAGKYAVAVTLAELVWLAGSSVSYPLVQRLAGSDDRRAAEATVRTVRMSLLVSALTAGAIAVGATVAVGPLYGDAFLPARDATWALLPGMLAMAGWRTAAGFLVRSGDLGPLSAGAAAALASNVVVNVALIPPLGIVGAGIASSISYALAAGAVAVTLHRRHGIEPSALLPRASDAARLARSLRPDALYRAARHGIASS
jgi:O-antigen/teichoic acid export membrane protein